MHPDNPRRAWPYSQPTDFEKRLDENLRVDWTAINICGDCSEKYGICGHHQKTFGVNFKGEKN